MKRNIQVIREALRLSQVQMSNLLDITQSGYSFIEGGKRNISLKFHSKLVDRLHVNAEHLKDGTGLMFTSDTPLLSSRLYKAMGDVQLSRTLLSSKLTTDDDKLLDQVLNNMKFPSKEFLSRIFTEYPQIDVDLLFKGEVMKNNLSSKIDENEKLSNKSNEEILFLKGIIDTFKKVIDSHEITINQLRNPPKSSKSKD